jgi:hypothetical protein
MWMRLVVFSEMAECDGSAYLILVVAMSLSRSCWQYFERADIIEGVFGLFFSFCEVARGVCCWKDVVGRIVFG